MKRKYLLWMLVQVMFFTSYLESKASHLTLKEPLNVSAESAEEYVMPKKDGNLGEKSVNGPVVFYDMGGKTGNSPGYFAGMLRFVPSQAGQEILIHFDNLNLEGAAKLYIYDSPVSFPSYSSPIPEGYIAELSGTLSDLSFQSSSGGLTVLYHAKGSSSGSGWEARVNAITPKDMEYKSSSANQSVIGSSYPGKLNQSLLRVNVVTDGSNNALNLSELSYSLDGTTDLNDIKTLKLYYTGSNEAFHSKAIVAEQTSVEKNGTFSLSQNLRSGNNYFWIVADINAQATPMHKLDASCPALKVNNIVRNVDNASPTGNINIDNVVLMSSGHSTYKVGSDPVSFYDDGGQDGNITEQFSGIVTFKPSTPGNKVQIRFVKLDLFNTSSTGLNDLLQIYDGAKVESEQLKYTVLKELVTAKSTAEDGSITISLISKTGIPKPGFEAIVEEFTPQVMNVQSISAAIPVLGNISSGQTDEQILKLNIQTEHTEPALKAEKFIFSASDCFQHIKKATLYYTGRENSFNTRNKAGEVVVENGQITLPSEVVLTEGDNYFWLTYDLKEYVPNGVAIDAAAQSVTLSGKDQTIDNGNPEGNRVVENKYISRIGHFTEKVTGTWMYTHRSNSAGSRYEAEIGDQIVTFVPMTAGKIIEIEFNDFDLYYSSSSYGVKAKYQIYSGANTNGSLLWELKSANDKSIGPNKVLRSESPDGSITVVFNANESGSSYTAKGWHAQIREYISKPMEIISVDALQASTDIIKPNAKDQQIIGIRIQAEGDLQPLSLSALNLSLKGSSEWIEKINIYYTGKNDQFSATQKVGELIAPEETAHITLDTPQALNENYSYYWVTYDMKGGVPVETPIDAALVSVQSGDKTVPATSGDPDGVRLTKNILDLQQGDNGTITVSGSLMFYDDGGSENKYSKSMNSRVTFIPSNPDKVIRLKFNSFVTHNNDEMKLYHGSEVKSSHDVKYYGNLNAALPGVFVSNASNGAVTVAFKSASYSTPAAGWDIEVQEYSPEPLTLGEVKVIPQTDKIFKGMSGEPILKVEVKVNGDKGEFLFEEFLFDAMNSANGAIARATLFSTDTISNYGPGKVFGQELTQTPYRFAGSQKVTSPGTYNFWLVYDIAATANVNDLIEAKLSSVQCNASAVDASATVPASVSVSEGFSGSYRVGSSPEASYATLDEAVSAMKNGIDGPVILELENGTYSGQIVIPHISGASEKNTIFIRSLSGKSDDVVFETNVYTEPPYGEEKNGMFTISGADHITVEGVKFTTKASWPSLLNIKNVSRYVTVRNCQFVAKTWSDYSGGSKLAYMEAANKSNHNNDFTTFESCSFEGGTYGVYMNGTGYVALQKERGGRIIKNTFRNQGSCAVYVTKEDDALIDGNVIENILSTASNFKAIDAVAMEGTIIRNNIISLAPQNYTSGIYLRKRDSQNDTRRTLIYNNEININDLNGTGTTYGINCTDPLVYTDIVYNTVRIARTSGTGKGAGVYFYATASKLPVDVTFKNNIVQNVADGYACYATSTSVFGDNETTFGKNVFYSSGANLAYAGADVADINAWQTISKDATSKAMQVGFVSNEILEPADGTALKFAEPLSFVTTDIKGQTRHLSAPTTGAYEFTGASDMPVMYEGYPSIGNITENQMSLIIKADNDGEVYYVIIPNGESVPSAEQIINNAMHIVIRKDKEHVIDVKGLNPLTEYRAYLVLRSIRGVTSNVLQSESFETASLPTVPSDFEKVTSTGENSFVDGTASFEGFSIVSITDGVGANNKKAAQWSGQAKVMLTNTPSGLILKGFYLKSENEIRMDIFQGDQKKTSQVIPAQPSWKYINLKNQGQLTSVELQSKGIALVDNFSGEPQKIGILINDITANEGETVSFVPVISGGVEPYSYEWRNSLKETVGTGHDLSFAPLHSGTYTLVVNDAWGSTAQSSASVIVTGQSYAATFEDLYLDSESHWAGDLSSEELMTESEFFSGSYAFNNLSMPSYNTWAFWGYSNETETSFATLKDQFRSAAGSGANASPTYAVAYADKHMGIAKVKVTHKTEGDSIKGFFVTNTAWVREAILNGDGMSSVPGGFVQNDSLILIIEGKNSGISTGVMRYPLADYRATDPTDHFDLDTWQWVDLRSLGQVTELIFRMDGSKTNSFGLTTPAYFCVDDFNGNRPEVKTEEIRIPKGQSSVSLQNYFSFIASEGTIAYQIVDKFDPVVLNATLNAGRLNLIGLKEGTADIVVKATQKGKSEYLRLPVTVDPSVDAEEVQEESPVVYYKHGSLYIQTSMENYSVELVSVSGVSTRFGNSYSRNEKIELKLLSSGIYIVKINSTEGNYVTKVYIK